MGFDIRCSICGNGNREEILTDVSTVMYDTESGTRTIFIYFFCEVCESREEIGRIEQPRVMFFPHGM